MAYSNHFKLADDIIAHLDPFVRNINDPFLQSRYVGFIAIAAVTVYELCIKDIFCDFAKKKHNIFGNFVEGYFDRISGRIKLDNIKNEYLKKFGDRYLKRFKRYTKAAEDICLKDYGKSMLSSYGNIIIWRHTFVHEGEIPLTATYDEVTKSYEIGKNVIIVLENTMYR